MPTSLAPLLSHPAIWRASRFQDAHDYQQQSAQGIPSGYARLDRELPDGGWPKSGVAELLQPRDAQGELALLAPALAQLSQQSRWLAWVAPPWVPYAPALARHGIRLEQVLLIRPTHLRDCLWAMEQCLSSGACAAVLGWPDAVQPQHVKRLHLAALQGQCLGVLMRDQRHSQAPSPAPLRMELGACTPLSNGQTQCNVRLIKRRGRWASDWIPLHWPAPLANTWHTTAGLHNQTPTTLNTETPSSTCPVLHENRRTPTHTPAGG